MEIPNQLCNIVWAIFLSHLNLKEENGTPESWLHKSQFHFCVFIYSMSNPHPSTVGKFTAGWSRTYVSKCCGVGWVWKLIGAAEGA